MRLIVNVRFYFDWFIARIKKCDVHSGTFSKTNTPTCHFIIRTGSPPRFQGTKVCIYNICIFWFLSSVLIKKMPQKGLFSNYWGYLLVNCNSIRRFCCKDFASLPNSTGCISPKPLGTKRRLDTPAFANSLATAVARNKDNSVLFL